MGFLKFLDNVVLAVVLGIVALGTFLSGGELLTEGKDLIGNVLILLGFFFLIAAIYVGRVKLGGLIPGRIPK